MHILVVNGSPKGESSVTLQTVEYLKLKNPGHTFEILHAGQRIRALEKDFAPAAEVIGRADAILFCYPVYTFIAPCQLHRFIELMKENHVDVSGKYATQITTSKHFYDITAHRYVMENAQDMGMRFVRGLSADMDDLTTEKGRREADRFFDYFVWCVEKGFSEPVLPEQPVPARVPATPVESGGGKTGDVVIVTDLENGDSHLTAMIERFRAVFRRNTRIVNIREYPFRGGCLGCFNCASTGKCIYKDGFDEFLRNTVQSAEAVVYAFSIKDHSMGARFKMYDDRQFCNGHRTVTMGSPVGYIISGNYACEENLRMIIEGRAEVGGNFFCGAATDETDTDAAIDRLASVMDYALANRHTQPANFLGVGGMKIFRDLIYLMQGMMRADHKFFKAHGQYDFPQKKKGRLIAMYLVGWMMSNETLKKKAGGKMTDGMLMPYKKVLDKVKKEMK